MAGSLGGHRWGGSRPPQACVHARAVLLRQRLTGVWFPASLPNVLRLLVTFPDFFKKNCLKFYCKRNTEEASLHPKRTGKFQRRLEVYVKLRSHMLFQCFPHRLWNITSSHHKLTPMSPTLNSGKNLIMMGELGLGGPRTCAVVLHERYRIQ